MQMENYLHMSLRQALPHPLDSLQILPLRHACLLTEASRPDQIRMKVQRKGVPRPLPHQDPFSRMIQKEDDAEPEWLLNSLGELD